MLTLISLPAFEDNIIWVLHDGQHAIAVDPGDPAVLIAFLDAQQLALTAVLITHHHRDHTGGNTVLREYGIEGLSEFSLPENLERAAG